MQQQQPQPHPQQLHQYEMLIRLLVSQGFKSQSKTQTRMPIKTLNAYWKK